MQPQPKQYYVEIVRRETVSQGVPERIERRMGPLSRSRADKVRDGAEINLNHDEYFVRVVVE